MVNLSKWFPRKDQQPAADVPLCTRFDPSTLDNSFNNLQSILHETSRLANAISVTLDTKELVEKKLYTILQVITDGIIIIDRNGVIQDWNGGCEQIFGYCANEAIDRNISEISGLNGDYLIDRRIKDHKGHIHCIHSFKKDGTPIILEVVVNTVPTDDGAIDSYVAVVRDVTQKVKAEQDEKNRLQIISTIVSVSCSLIIVKDPTGRWTYVNETGKHIYKFVSDKEWLNCTDEEIIQNRPELANAFRKTSIYDAKTWEIRKPFYSDETVTLGKSIHNFNVVRTPLYNENGSKNSLVYVAQDITELTQKQQHAHIAYKALNASSDMVAITDDEGYIVFANDAFIRTYKYIDRDDLVGKNMSMLHSQHTSKEVYDKLWATIKAGRVFHREMINVDRHGGEVRVSNTIMPIVDKELETPFFICIGKLSK